MIIGKDMLSIQDFDKNLERFRLANSKTESNVDSVKKLSQEFESIFMDIVLKSMRESTSENPLTSGGSGGKVFQSMLDSEYSKLIVSQNQSGLARSIEEHLASKLIEVNQPLVNEKSSGLMGYKKNSK